MIIMTNIKKRKTLIVVSFLIADSKIGQKLGEFRILIANPSLYKTIVSF